MLSAVYRLLRPPKLLVGLVGLEPTTPALSRRCSNQLSYRPVILWWRMTGSNRRPPACKAGALPAELIPRSLPSAAQPHSLAARPDSRYPHNIKQPIKVNTAYRGFTLERR